MSFLPDALTKIFRRTPAEATPAEDPAETRQVPYAEQIILDEAEENLLIHRIEEDMNRAEAEHQRRRNRNERLQVCWDQNVDQSMPAGKPNAKFPLILIQVLLKMAVEMQSLFGEESSVKAVPTKPTDEATVAKVGAYMRWVVFSAMPNFLERFCVFIFRRVLFGFAGCGLTYEQRFYDDAEGERVMYSESPEFKIVNDADLYTPGEDAESLQDLSFVIERFPVTPDQLLLDESEKGLYYGIADDWDRIREMARNNGARGDRGSGHQPQMIKEIVDRAEGVDRSTGAYDSYEVLEAWKWCGRWRMKLADTQDTALATPTAGAESSVSDQTGTIQTTPAEPPEGSGEPEREQRETDLIVVYFPQLRKIKRCQRLREQYPRTPDKRPYYSSTLIKDGRFFGKGFGEILEWVEAELTKNNNLFTQGGQFSIGPLIFYRPSSGASPDVLKYEPNLMIPTANPQQDVNVVNMRIDPNYFVMQQNNLLTIVERLTGNLDASTGDNSGRAFGQRTARGTLAVLQRGDVRVSLDTTFLLNDFGKLLRRIWELCCMYAPSEQFFRVTGEYPTGLFEMEKGFAKITAEEFAGEFDFELKPAVGFYAKEAHKDDLMQSYGLLLQNPLFMSNPRALWQLTVDTFKPFGLDIKRMLPEPPEPPMSIAPDEEWSKMLQGEHVHVSPLDNDAMHLEQHRLQLVRHHALAPERQDVDAMNKLIDHIGETEVQQQQKAQMAMLTQAVGDQISRLMQNGAMADQQAGQPGAAPPMGGPPQTDPMMAEIGGQGGAAPVSPGTM